MAETIDRRRFLVLAAGGAALGALAILQACSSSDDSDAPPTTPEPPETPTYTDKSGSISDNHGHSVTLTAAQQEAGQNVDLTLSSGDVPGPHTHTLELTGTDVAAVAGGSRLSRTTSSDLGHTHTVTFN